MSITDDIINRARSRPQHIVMAEGEDSRIVEGSLRATRDGIARITLIGNDEAVRAAIQNAGGNDANLAIIDPKSSPLKDRFAESYHELRRHKGVDQDRAAQTVTQPLEFAAMMVREGHGDGTIAGAVATTADTVRAAFQIIGRAKDAKLVSSFFLMNLDQPHHHGRGPVLFADCALVIDPDADELVEIASASAQSCRIMLGCEPRIAMLSFSTLGSAKHERIDKVANATAILKERLPDLIIDGELQFDSAFAPDVARTKAPNSRLSGDANVFIFPSLESANIGYKIAQRIGAASAIGPVLQGLAKPANDLSRGCSADDVYHLIAITSAQAGRT